MASFLILKLLDQHKFHAFLHLFGQRKGLLQLVGGDHVLPQEIVIFGTGSKTGTDRIQAFFNFGVAGIQLGSITVEVMGLIAKIALFQLPSDRKINRGKGFLVYFQPFDQFFKFFDGLGWRMHLQQAFHKAGNDFFGRVLFFKHFHVFSNCFTVKSHFLKCRRTVKNFGDVTLTGKRFF